MSKWNIPSSQTYENAEATKKYSFGNAESEITVKLSPKPQKVILKERNCNTHFVKKGLKREIMLLYSYMCYPHLSFHENITWEPINK